MVKGSKGAFKLDDVYSGCLFLVAFTGPYKLNHLILKKKKKKALKCKYKMSSVVMD